MLSSPSTWFVGGKRARQAQSDGNTRIRTVLPGCTLLLIASFGAQSDRFALLWSDLPTSLYVPNSALPALCQHLAAAACFFDWRTVPARRSASKRCHLDDHGPQKEPPRSPFWPLRVFDSPLCPRWSHLAIETVRRHLAAQKEDNMITVGNKKQGARGIYVGRPSPPGNPFRCIARWSKLRSFATTKIGLRTNCSIPAARQALRFIG